MFTDFEKIHISHFPCLLLFPFFSPFISSTRSLQESNQCPGTTQLFPIWSIFYFTKCLKEYQAKQWPVMGDIFLPTVIPKSDQKVSSKKTCQKVTRSSSPIQDHTQHQVILPREPLWSCISRSNGFLSSNATLAHGFLRSGCCFFFLI